MALILPNTLANLIPADGVKLQQNFATIQDYINQETITRDGSTAMLAPLLLPGDPTQPNQASNKAYVDAQIAAQVNVTQSTQFRSVTIPSGQTDAANGAMADWLMTTLIAPTWAKQALVNTSVTGVFETAGANLPFALCTRVLSIQGSAVNIGGHGINQRFAVSYNDYYTLPSTGTLAFGVMAMRQSGGAVRFDAASRATFHITFLAAT